MKKYFLSLLCFCCAVIVMDAQQIEGSWNGVLNAGLLKLRIVFNIDKGEKGLVATMDSPDQGAKGIPVNETEFRNDTLWLKIPALGLSYIGQLKDTLLTGVLTQGGGAFPLTLVLRAPVALKRPQTPTFPYPYHSEEIRFENKSAGITLVGTLSYPESGNNFPAVVLISGSGPQNRDEELFGHRPFLVLSDYLTRQGIAVLRYDDRGTAQSEGDYKTATLQDLATDALAAVNYLKTRKEINGQEIGLIGHSEGGTIAFLLAAEHKKEIAYIITMAGAAVYGDTLLKAQRYLLAKAAGASEQAIAANERLVESMSKIADKYDVTYIISHQDKIVDEILPDTLKRNAELRNLVKKELPKLLAPEIVSLRKFDPAPFLRKIQCPVLALNGDKDLQVPADMNLKAVKTFVKKHAEIKKYKGLNHLFQHATTGLPMEYGQLEETIAPEVLQNMADWIHKITR